MAIRTAMILAAGRGERMRPLTDDTPKPLLEAGGRALIDYPLRALARAGVSEVVINLAWHGTQIRAHVGDGVSYGLRVRYSEEPTGALETGGGVRNALPLLGAGPFWLVNADVFSDYSFADGALSPGCLAHLVLVPNPAHNPAGDFRLAGGWLRPDRGEPLTYSGIALLSASLFAGSEPGRFPLAPLLRAAVERGLVSGERYGGLWTDAGTPERLERLDRLLRERSGA